MQRYSKRLILINAFGALGYLSVFLQWGWSFLVLSYPVLAARPEYIFPKDQPQVDVTTLDATLSPFMIVIALAVTAVILAATTIVLLRLPKTIGQQGAKLTHVTARSIIPAITHHKKISKKKREKLSYRVILVIKLVLIIVPLLALPFVQPINQIPVGVIWVLALFCAACSIVYFSVQLLLTKLTHADTGMVW